MQQYQNKYIAPLAPFRLSGWNNLRVSAVRLNKAGGDSSGGSSDAFAAGHSLRMGLTQPITLGVLSALNRLPSDNMNPNPTKLITNICHSITIEHWALERQ
jgi:hypothetical protein